MIRVRQSVLRQWGVWSVVALLCATVAQAQTEYRAFWADAFSIGFKNSSQVSSLVSRAQSGNYNVIIAEVMAFQDTGASAHGAYWNSNIVPKASDISSSFDPLATLIAQAHAANIKVYAWIVPFRVSASWPPNGNSTLSAHPEWTMVPLGDMNGGPAAIAGYYTLDPGSPDVQEYLVSIVRELVTNYAIDGINLDYIRYVQEDAGYPAYTSYDKSSLARFQVLTGYAGTPAASGVGSWDDFRRQTINELVRRLRAEIPAIGSNPQQPVALTADLIASGDAPFNFAASSAYSLFQNWRLWMEEGWLDVGVPMNYKREYISQQATWYRNWVDAAVDWQYDRHVICGQANYLNTKADSIVQLTYARNAGVNGMCNYSYDATADENTDGTPETDWTWYTYVSANVFTSAASVPTMPWRNSATATEGTLWGQIIDDSTGEPLDGATVQIGGQPSVQTDGNGYYVVTQVPAAAGGTSYTVTASVAGCSTEQSLGVVITRAGLTWVPFVLCDAWGGPGDMDEDGDIDFTDFAYFSFCMAGPDSTYPPGNFCVLGDADGDLDEDLADMASFQVNFLGQ